MSIWFKSEIHNALLLSATAMLFSNACSNAGAEDASSESAANGLASSETQVEGTDATGEIDTHAASTQAGIIIRFGDNSYCTQCVNFNSGETEMTGEELLLRAGRVVAELANFGSDANPDRAVCKLTAPVNGRVQTDGCDASNCFCNTAMYWGYFGQTASGWDYHSTGPTKHVVKPGDVDGWSWTEYPETLPPNVSLNAICAPAAPTDCAYRVFLPAMGR